MKRQLIIMGMLALGGCGEEMGAGDSPEIASKSSALECISNPNDPNCVWKVLGRLLPANGAGADIVHEQAPALCGNNQAAIVFSVEATTHRYRTLQLNGSANSPTWGAYTTKAFASKPACTFREDVGSNAGIVLAGKGTDGLIYASAGVAAPPGLPQGVPTPGSFVAVSGTVYSNGQTNVAGDPALSTGGFTVQKVGMVFMGNDNRTIFAHLRPLPYSQNAWTARITGPQLPTGWTAFGVPSIVSLPVTFYIVVHARNGSQDRLFATYLYGDGGYFSNAIGSPVPGWDMLPDLGSIEISPSLTLSNVHGMTVYFLRSGQIMQTTEPFGQHPLLAVKPNAGFVFASSPSGSDNWGIDSQGGTHNIVARTTSNQLAFGVSNMDSSIEP